MWLCKLGKMNALRERFSALGTGINLQDNVLRKEEFEECVTTLLNDLRGSLVNENYIASHKIHIRHLEHLRIQVDGLHAVGVSARVLPRLAGDVEDHNTLCKCLRKLHYSKNHWDGLMHSWSSHNLEQHLGRDFRDFVASYFKFETAELRDVDVSLAIKSNASTTQPTPIACNTEYGM